MTAFHAVQIGAHRGDEFASAAAGGARCLMVEPVLHLFERLANRFAGLPNVTTENIALAGLPGRRPLFYLRDRPDLPSWSDQIASLAVTHIKTLAEQERFPVSYGEALTEVAVECLTLDQLCAKHRITSINTLLVDAEGFDYPILIDFDFSRVQINRIIFERKHTDGVRRTERRYNHLVDKLQQLGYAVNRMDSQNTLAVLSVDFAEIKRRHTGYLAEEFPGFLRNANSRSVHPTGRQRENDDRGVVYWALGAKRYDACRRSISILRQHNPDIPVTIFTDQATAGAAADHNIIGTTDADGSCAFSTLRHSPYARSLYLAPETWVIGPIDELFDDLKEADWAVAEAADFRYFDGDFVFEGWARQDMFDGSVVGFRKTDAVFRLLDRWAERVKNALVGEGTQDHDQFFDIFADPDMGDLHFAKLDNRRWNLSTQALGAARRKGLLPQARILRGSIWEARRYWGIDLEALVAERLSGDGVPGDRAGRGLTSRVAKALRRSGEKFFR